MGVVMVTIMMKEQARAPGSPSNFSFSPSQSYLSLIQGTKSQGKMFCEENAA
jgi:hypothetical protein